MRNNIVWGAVRLIPVILAAAIASTACGSSPAAPSTGNPGGGATTYPVTSVADGSAVQSSQQVSGAMVAIAASNFYGLTAPTRYGSYKVVPTQLALATLNQLVYGYGDINGGTTPQSLSSHLTGSITIVPDATIIGDPGSMANLQSAAAKASAIAVPYTITVDTTVAPGTTRYDAVIDATIDSGASTLGTKVRFRSLFWSRDVQTGIHEMGRVVGFTGYTPGRGIMAATVAGQAGLTDFTDEEKLAAKALLGNPAGSQLNASTGAITWP